jgi:thiol-disulfide isomerase/thioredoxin
MSGIFLTSYALLWLIVATLVVLVVLLYRQFGLMYMRSGRRIDLLGLDVGAQAPELTVATPDAGLRTLTWRHAVGTYEGSVALFALPTCAICRSIAEDAHEVAEQWPSVEFVWIDRELRMPEDAGQQNFMRGWQIALSEDEAAFKEFEIGALPFVYAIGKDGTILSKKLVNTARDIHLTLESALGRKRTDDAGNTPATVGGRS